MTHLRGWEELLEAGGGGARNLASMDDIMERRWTGTAGGGGSRPSNLREGVHLFDRNYRLSLSVHAHPKVYAELLRRPQRCKGLAGSGACSMRSCFRSIYLSLYNPSMFNCAPLGHPGAVSSDQHDLEDHNELLRQPQPASPAQAAYHQVRILMFLYQSAPSSQDACRCRQLETGSLAFVPLHVDKVDIVLRQTLGIAYVHKPAAGALGVDTMLPCHSCMWWAT